MDPSVPNGAPRTNPPIQQLLSPMQQLVAEENSAQRLKTACSHCRQQKIKCRTNDDLTTPCDRCAKMKLTCTYEPRHARGRPRSGSEIVNDTPKRRLVAKADGDDGFRPFVAVNSSGQPDHAGPNPQTEGESIHERPSPPHTALSTNNSLPPTSSVSAPWRTIAGIKTNVSPPRSEPKSSYTSPVQTLSRSIDGLQLDAEVIDNLFEQYFRCYHPFLPVLDPSLRPNEYHAQSSFLFWSIIAVASRRWPKDATLMSALRSRTLTHAMTSIFSPNTGTSTITAVLLLLSWSFPETQTYDEMPYTFSSALVHAALRAGMNTPAAAQDFSRVKLSLSDAECKRRFQLYLYCLVLYQRSSCCMGNSFGQIPTHLSHEVQRYVASLPPSLYFQIELSDTLSRATVALANNGLELDTQAQYTAFDAILQNHQAEISLYESRQVTPLGALDRLYVSIARLMLHAYQFFKTPAEKHLADWRPAFDTACTLIHQVNELEKSMHIDLYGTSHVYHGVLLAACTILRCLKTPFADTIGEYSSTAQALFFSAINMNRNISIVEGDKPAKSAWALQNLWRSDSIFKHADGSWNLDLRVRGRFSSGVLYDTMMWCRGEVSAQGDAYSRKGSGAPPTPAWSNHENSALHIGAGTGFTPDLFADMTFTQDWVLNDWERNSASLETIPNETTTPGQDRRHHD